MAITPLPDGVSVSVDTFTDLKTFLQAGSGYTDYTTAYLTLDIVIAVGGISIDPGRTNVTVDGTDPNDSSGQTIHTITDAPSAAAADCIGVRSVPAADMHVVFSNLIWVGRNYFGAFYTSDVAGYSIVTVTFEKVSYIGPQIVHHPYGTTRFLDCSIKTAASISAVAEVGEVNVVVIGGTTTIEQISTVYPVFFFRIASLAAPALTILPDSNVTFIAGHDIVQGSYNYPALTVGARARFTVQCQATFIRVDPSVLSNALIDTDAVFTVRQTGVGTPNFSVAGALTVNENAVFDIRSSYNDAGRLLYFYPVARFTASLNLNNPAAFILYKQYNNNLINFATTTNINITTQQLNIWDISGAANIAGTLDDVPTYSWRKSDNSALVVTGTATATSNTLSTNLSAEEFAHLPALSNMRLYYARTLSAGKLPLSVAPVTDDGAPVTGTTAKGANLLVNYTGGTVPGIADDTGGFSVGIPATTPGTLITVKSNLPFLISTVETRSFTPGTLELLYVPEWMYFILAPITFTPVVLYGRQEPDWYMTVEDSRGVNTPWYLYATVDGPLVSEENPAHTVPGAIVFVDADDAITPLSAEPVLVYTGQGNGGSPKSTDISWDALSGILLQAVAAPYFNGEIYRANISWDLSDTRPDN